MNHPQIAAFARLAKENTRPTRKLEGQRTLLGRTMHDLAYDPIHDEIVVSNPFAQAILTFRGGAGGEEPPIRVIQGPHTRIVSDGALDKVSIDPVNNEIIVATSVMNILTFPRDANGDAAPIRVLGGPETLLTERPSIRVDPIRNLLIVTGRDGLLVFDRTASGNARPRVIRGPATGHQFDLYAPTGLVVTHRDGAIEGWSIEEGLKLADDEAERLRPLWKIPMNTIVDPDRTAGQGIVLNPANKEIMASVGESNTVWTFSVPEAFEDAPARTARTARRLASSR